MAMVRLPDNGQEFPLDDEIAGNDGRLKDALRVIWPEVGDPQIKRENVNGQMVVTVVKQAGRKGAKAPATVADAEEVEDGAGTVPEARGLFADGVQPDWMAVQMDLDAAGEPLNFDYSTLDAPVREEVQEHARNIKLRWKRSVHDMVQIGKSLTRVKASLPHGQWLPWLETELELSADMAARFMQVAARYGDNPQVGQYATSALYLLAAPSTPDSAREEAQARAEAGQEIGTVAARDIVTTHRDLQQRAAATGEVHELRQGGRSFTFEPDEEESAGRVAPASLPEADRSDGTTSPAAQAGESAGSSVAGPAQATAPARPASPAAPPQTSRPSPSASQSPAATRSSGAAPAPPPAAPAPAAPPVRPTVPPSFDQSKINVSLLLYPEGRDPRGRLVMVSVQVEGQPVVTRTLHYDDLLPLPPVVAEALEDMSGKVEAARALVKGMLKGSSAEDGADAEGGEDAEAGADAGDKATEGEGS